MPATPVTPTRTTFTPYEPSTPRQPPRNRHLNTRKRALDSPADPTFSSGEHGDFFFQLSTSAAQPVSPTRSIPPAPLLPPAPIFEPLPPSPTSPVGPHSTPMRRSPAMNNLSRFTAQVYQAERSISSSDEEDERRWQRASRAPIQFKAFSAPLSSLATLPVENGQWDDAVEDADTDDIPFDLELSSPRPSSPALIPLADSLPTTFSPPFSMRPTIPSFPSFAFSLSSSLASDTDSTWSSSTPELFSSSLSRSVSSSSGFSIASSSPSAPYTSPLTTPGLSFSPSINMHSPSLVAAFSKTSFFRSPSPSFVASSDLARRRFEKKRRLAVESQESLNGPVVGLGLAFSQ
ncbi:hypothetical protein NBRC10512_003712 [Rhodotorula toruloides]|uniref:RHTO0S13e03576g1_1 n=2 Tax=Rhodotorula toruloides TaxID=5286 RepID=A0A061BIX0_RHOTO|nr:uncharacterized protein RHTO_00712 [Rhodotorula toruloides NP11]EMS22433.1 hypothetical protein RHTO_00712 [Rhodotorula toruloides NP11]CDR46928.1 RHTO0S13e03576g1_1 [Rhodotorula toruloides]